MKFGSIQSIAGLSYAKMQAEFEEETSWRIQTND